MRMRYWVHLNSKNGKPDIPQMHVTPALRGIETRNFWSFLAPSLVETAASGSGRDHASKAVVESGKKGQSVPSSGLLHAKVCTPTHMDAHT